MLTARLYLAFVLAVGPVELKAQQWSTSGEGMRCVPLRRADTAKLWLRYGKRDTGVETAGDAAGGLDAEGRSRIFGVEFGADRRIAECMRVRWRVEPWGNNPVNAADFGGHFPSGTMDLVYNARHNEVDGAIQVRLREDHIRERPETFRIVLLDALTGVPLAGIVGARDPKTGSRARIRAPQSLDMKNRMVMTVEDVAERPRTRR